MSVGFWIGLKHSYPEPHRDEAQRFIDAINQSLGARGLSLYSEALPAPDIYQNHHFGRSSLDHFGAGGLSAFVSFVATCGLQEHFQVRGPRDVYLPIDFDAPLVIPFGRFLFLPRTARVGSSYTLQRALIQLAPELGIQLAGDVLPDATAKSITGLVPLGTEDTEPLIEILRPAWLLYFEGARLSIDTGFALALAA